MGELYIFPSFSIVLLPAEVFTNEGLHTAGQYKYLCKSSHQLVSVVCSTVSKWKQSSVWVLLESLCVKCSCSLVRGHSATTQRAEPPHSPAALQGSPAANVLFSPRAESGNLELDYPGNWRSKAMLPVLWRGFMLVLYMERSNN